jgi:predicted nucleic acid-binding protein
MNVVDSSAWLEYFADSIILATARVHGATLWTQDADFQGRQGMEYRPRGAT